MAYSYACVHEVASVMSNSLWPYDSVHRILTESDPGIEPYSLMSSAMYGGVGSLPLVPLEAHRHILETLQVSFQNITIKETS